MLLSPGSDERNSIEWILVSYYHAVPIRLAIQQNAFKDLDFVGTARAVAKCDFGVIWPREKKSWFVSVLKSIENRFQNAKVLGEQEVDL